MKAVNSKKVSKQNSPELPPEPATNSEAQPPQDNLREQIEREAYLAWEKNGRDHGRDQDYWFEAEKKLRAQGNPAYPPLEEREKLVKDAVGEKTPVRKIPADDLAQYAKSV